MVMGLGEKIQLADPQIGHVFNSSRVFYYPFGTLRMLAGLKAWIRVQVIDTLPNLSLHDAYSTWRQANCQPHIGSMEM
jgi:hypothetical protein